MKAQVKVTGVSEVRLELRNIGDRVVETARKTMHRSAQRIETMAKRMAPVDHGNLEESIHIERSTGDRGRLQLDVVAGGVVNGVDTDQYAAIMHESDYELGWQSIDKQASNPDVVVGRKYLERAAEDEEAKLRPRMIAAVMREIE